MYQSCFPKKGLYQFAPTPAHEHVDSSTFCYLVCCWFTF